MGAEKGSTRYLSKRRKLLRVAILQVPNNNLIDLFYRRRLPIVHGQSLYRPSQLTKTGHSAH